MASFTLRLRALAAVALDGLGVASLRELLLEEELRRLKRQLLAADEARREVWSDRDKWRKRARVVGRKSSARAKELRRRDVAGAELNARMHHAGLEGRALDHVRRALHSFEARPTEAELEKATTLEVFELDEARAS